MATRDDLYELAHRSLPADYVTAFAVWATARGLPAEQSSIDRWMGTFEYARHDIHVTVGRMSATVAEVPRRSPLAPNDVMVWTHVGSFSLKALKLAAHRTGSTILVRETVKQGTTVRVTLQDVRSIADELARRAEFWSALASALNVPKNTVT